MPTYDFVCEQCGKHVVKDVHTSTAPRFCSRQCSGISQRTRVIRQCETCGGDFEASQWHISQGFGRFCSKQCYDEWQTGRPNRACKKDPLVKTCPQCNQVFEVTPSLSYRIYCSMNCYAASRVGVPFNVGARNPQWKGGYSRDTRHSKAIKDWRKAVYRRDDYTCQDCGNRGGYLHAHHLKPWADHPELRFDVANGRTLCVDCHKKYHPDVGFLQ